MFNLDKVALALSIAGAIFLAFWAGVAAHYYHWELTSLLDDAAVAVQALIDEQDAPDFVSDLKDQSFLGEVTKNDSRASGDYTLIAARAFKRVSLIDMSGKEVFYWQLPLEDISSAFAEDKRHPIYIASSQLFANGDLLCVLFTQGKTPYGYALVRLDKHSRLIWAYRPHPHHVAYIDQRNQQIHALTHHVIRKSITGLEFLSYPILADSIVTLSPDGKELDRISILDAFIDTPYVGLLKNSSGERWDLLHTNSIVKLEPELAGRFPMFKPGYILISIRNLSLLAVIDPQIRKVVWAQNAGWYQQHDASFTERGTILLFDNLGFKQGNKQFSRVVEYNPATDRIEWDYSGDKEAYFKSETYGRAQALAQENVLITSSYEGRIFEVSRQGELLWNYELPKPLMREKRLIVSAVRYSKAELPFLLQMP